MRSTSWKFAGHGSPSVIEADACFYTGNSAVACNAAGLRSESFAGDFVKTTSPDLVVEIEAARIDGDRETAWAKLGVKELWRIYPGNDGSPCDAVFVDIQAEERPGNMAGSRLFPGLVPKTAAFAVHMAKWHGMDELDAFLGEVFRSAPS